MVAEARGDAPGAAGSGVGVRGTSGAAGSGSDIGVRSAAGSAPPGEVGASVEGAPALPPVAVAGLSRKRLSWIVAGVVAAWILVTFARQVGDAAETSARADRTRSENASISAELDRRRAELAFIQEPRFIAQQARAYGVGTRREHPFTLGVDAPPLPADAPGSASLRVGFRTYERTPLEAWIQVLFGSPPGS